MSLLVNSAGGSAADPILKGLGLEFVADASTVDLATLTNMWLDQNSTFPGTNSLLPSGISPASTVVTSGNNAAITAPGVVTISSTTGLIAGDYLFLSGGSLSAGVWKIASVDDATHVTLTGYSSGVQSGIAYQVAWRTLSLVAGTAPIVSSGAGTQNWLKFRGSDSAANQADVSDSFFASDAPAGANYIKLAGSKSYLGQTVNTFTPAIAILTEASRWANRGGITHVAFGAHSVQTGNSDFRHSDASLTEKTLAVTETNGLSLTAGQGMKYGSIKFSSKSGGVILSVDMDVLVDTVAPTIQLRAFGR